MSDATARIVFHPHARHRRARRQQAARPGSAVYWPAVHRLGPVLVAVDTCSFEVFDPRSGEALIINNLLKALR